MSLETLPSADEQAASRQKDGLDFLAFVPIVIVYLF
jgi:hypothetical protein